jgi:hypothetical protein
VNISVLLVILSFTEMISFLVITLGRGFNQASNMNDVESHHLNFDDLKDDKKTSMHFLISISSHQFNVVKLLHD